MNAPSNSDIKPKTPENKKFLIPDEEESHSRIIIHDKQFLKLIKKVLIILWITGISLAIIDILFNISDYYMFFGSGFPIKPYILITTNISYIFIIIELLGFIVALTYFFVNYIKVKAYVLKKTYKSLFLYLLCEFIIHFVYFVAMVWGEYLNIDGTFEIFLMLYFLFVIQIAKFIFIYQIIDRFIWMDGSKYYSIFFVFILFPLFVSYVYIEHPWLDIELMVMLFFFLVSNTFFFVYKIKTKKIKFRFFLSWVNINMITFLVICFFINPRYGSAIGSNFYSFYIPFQAFIVIGYHIQLIRKTEGPVSKNGKQLIYAMLLFLFQTFVISGYAYLAIPDMIIIYLSPLLVLTALFLIVSSKNIFYNLYNTLTQEQKCLVHKGKIYGKRYICPKCSSTYCRRCYFVLKNSKDQCWNCLNELI